MADDTKASPEFPSKPYNRIVPLSQRSSGSELDPVCGSGIEQAEAGTGLDAAIKKIDGGKK
jgi:hypothetical protein